jgi:hypothetical protein
MFSSWDHQRYRPRQIQHLCGIVFVCNLFQFFENSRSRKFFQRPNFQRFIRTGEVLVPFIDRKREHALAGHFSPFVKLSRISQIVGPLDNHLKMPPGSSVHKRGFGMLLGHFPHNKTLPKTDDDTINKH